MGFWEALGDFTEGVAGMVKTGLKSGELSLQIRKEEQKIEEFSKSIGMLVLDKLDLGQTYDDEIMALYSSIQASRAVIEDLKAEKEQLDAEEEPEEPVEVFCSNCGMKLEENVKFCPNCGTKAEIPERYAEVSPAPAEEPEAEASEAEPPKADVPEAAPEA